MFRKFWDNLFSSSYSYFSITFCTWKIVILSTVMREKGAREQYDPTSLKWYLLYARTIEKEQKLFGSDSG